VLRLGPGFMGALAVSGAVAPGAGCSTTDWEGIGGAGASVGSWSVGCCGAALGAAGALTAGVSSGGATSWAQATVGPSASTAQIAVAARSERVDACVMKLSLDRQVRFESPTPSTKRSTEPECTMNCYIRVSLYLFSTDDAGVIY
jgi:hypothetical protein